MINTFSNMQVQAAQPAEESALLVRDTAMNDAAAGHGPNVIYNDTEVEERKVASSYNAREIRKRNKALADRQTSDSVQLAYAETQEMLAKRDKQQ